MKKSKKFNSGFTLIELLVVIAIIGILASVVLAALGSARNKGKDAAVQSQLASMRAQAELYYSTTGNNTYGTATTSCAGAAGTLTSSSDANSLSKLLVGLTGPDCGSAPTVWSVAAPGSTANTFYCVDSTGTSRSTLASGTAYSTLTGATGPHTAVGATVCN